jgi:CheY-like chemotaxis protein
MGMNVGAWNVAIVTANRFEGKLQTDLLRGAGARRVAVIHDRKSALSEVGQLAANIIILAIDDDVSASLDWVRDLRRAKRSAAQKASVFLTSPHLTISLAEQCRRAGANAIIGLPISNATLLNTINKVLARPRPFVETDVYVGPCRRAGIVSAGTGKFRRKSDEPRAA